MKKYALDMSTTEVIPITIPVRMLQDGESVTDTAIIEHTPPSGDPVDIDYTVDETDINFLLGPLGVVGQHLVKVQAQGDQGSKPEVLFEILVEI
jgi:hypothetical protein